MIKITQKHKLILLVLVFGAILLLLAVYDERLNPDIKGFTDFSKEQVYNSQNCFFAFLGFSAPSGSDIHAKGLELLDKNIAAYQRNPLSDNFYQEMEHKLEFKEKKQPSGQIKNPGDTKKSPQEIEQLMRDNQELLARYYSLYRYQYFREPIDSLGAMVIPYYSTIRKVHSLILEDITCKASNGGAFPALQKLQADTLFWRSTLKESRQLITKLVSVSMIQTNLKCLSEIIRGNSLSNNEQQVASNILRRLEPADFDLAKTWRYEFAYQQYMIRKIQMLSRNSANVFRGEVGFVLLPFFKGNSTTNKLYEHYTHLARISQLPTDRLKQELAWFDARQAETFGLAFLYNPVGLMLQKIVEPQFGGYIARMHNLEGFRRMVALQFEAKKRNVPVGKMGDFIRSAGTKYNNPYTGTPMEWDEDKHVLFFHSIVSYDNKPIELVI